MCRVWVFVSLWIAGVGGMAQQTDRKMLEALPVQEEITLDGKLNEAVWQQAAIAKDFVEAEPEPFGMPYQPTEVRVLYSEVGLYIGAELYDSAPDSILSELSPRDQQRNTDFFGVIIDPYLDGINGMGFIVTASGVQGDLKFTIDGDDESWDAVWWSRVQVHDRGWTVEMLIPYAALRFSKEAGEVWGINFGRHLRRQREESWWNPINRNVEGIVNQNGRLTGMKNISSPPRISITPYVSSYLDIINRTDGAVLTNSYNAGLDLKYGINDAFTLDMTLIPDFGQVIYDDQILNLGPFEVQFNENRAFFTEGTELFSKGNVFYSRRIGDQPLHATRPYRELQEGERVVNNPLNSQLINATKISGRNRKKLGIAIFNAVESDMYATIENEQGQQRQVLTNPLTNYNMVVLDQALPNNSYFTLYNTNVLRNGSDYDANVTGTDWQLRDEKNEFYVEGNVTVSQLYGKQAPGEADLGYRYKLEAGRMSGKFLYNVNYYVESDRFDVNDFGFLLANNERNVSLNFAYNEFTPFGIVNWTRNDFGILYSRLHNPNEFTRIGMWVNNVTTFKNFFTTGLDVYYEPTGFKDYFEPRTAGRYFHRPAQLNLFTFFSPDYRKPFIVDGRGYVTKYIDSDWLNTGFTLSPRWRVNDQVTFNYSISRWFNFNEIGYTTRFDGEPIFGQRDVNTWEQSLRASIIFNPLMNITLRARHYWSKAVYDRFLDLNADGTTSLSDYEGYRPEGGTIHDVSFNAWTVDLGYFWQFAPGSQLSLVWKNAIFQQGEFIPVNFGNNWDTMWDAPQQYSLSMRVIYYLDYLTFRKPALPRIVTAS